MVFLRFPVSPVASHPLLAAVGARCSYRFLQYFAAFPLVFLRFPVSPLASHPLPAAVGARCSYRFLRYFAVSIETWPLGRRRCRTAFKYAVKIDVDVATLAPLGQILYRPVHWPAKTGPLVYTCFSVENWALGRRRCRTACKYAVKVDVVVATLRPLGQILYRSVHWRVACAQADYYIYVVACARAGYNWLPVFGLTI